MQIYASTTDAKEAVIDWFYENLQDLLELAPKKDWIIRDWNAKGRSQEISIITGKFVLGVQNEAGLWLT